MANLLNKRSPLDMAIAYTGRFWLTDHPSTYCWGGTTGWRNPGAGPRTAKRETPDRTISSCHWEWLGPGRLAHGVGVRIDGGGVRVGRAALGLDPDISVTAMQLCVMKCRQKKLRSATTNADCLSKNQRAGFRLFWKQKKQHPSQKKYAACTFFH